MTQQRTNKEARLRRALANAERQLEAEFREERADAAAHFHNAVKAVIDEQRPSVETQLYVFELIRWELMALRHEQHFGPASPVHGDGNALSVGIA